MGTYTTNFRFYKPDPSEFVDVQTNLNNNWDIADFQIKQLFEYRYLGAGAVFSPESTVQRAKFFASEQNTPQLYTRNPDGSGTYTEDPNCTVSRWILWQPNVPYVAHPLFPIRYRLIKKASSPTTTEVEWTGAVWLNGSDLPLNSYVAGFLTYPDDAKPVVAKYFTVNAGNTSTNYSVARIGIFPGSNGMDFKRYGSNPTSSDEKRIELTGIRYNVEVAA